MRLQSQISLPRDSYSVARPKSPSPRVFSLKKREWVKLAAINDQKRRRSVKILATRIGLKLRYGALDLRLAIELVERLISQSTTGALPIR